jgi:hypothetical protein
MTFVKQIAVTIASGASESGEFYAADTLNLMIHASEVAQTQTGAQTLEILMKGA